MSPPQREICYKLSDPKTSLPNNNKKNEDNAVPVRSHRPRRRRQVNQVHRNYGQFGKDRGISFRGRLGRGGGQVKYAIGMEGLGGG